MIKWRRDIQFINLKYHWSIVFDERHKKFINNIFGLIDQDEKTRMICVNSLICLRNVSR